MRQAVRRSRKRTTRATEPRLPIYPITAIFVLCSIIRDHDVKVSAVYIDLEQYSHPTKVRARYQLASNYLSLFISDWVNERILDFGNFNRFVFVEGSKVDMKTVGDRALSVNISEAMFLPESPLASDEESGSALEIHNYFVRKYLEGFNRVDQHFKLSLSTPLAEAISANFSKSLIYEKPVGEYADRSKRLRLIHRYTTDRYQLVAIENDGKDVDLAREFVLMDLIPDPFKVYYHVAHITVDGRRVYIANRTDSEVIVKEI